MTNKINIHIIHVSRLFYSKYWFKLLAKHYIIWMNFIVMSKRFHFSKPLTQCSWFPIKDFILPSRWYGLIDCYLWSSALVSMSAHIQQYSMHSLIRCHWKLISQTAGWKTLNSVLIDHLKEGVSWCIVNRLLIFINNVVKRSVLFKSP